MNAPRLLGFVLATVGVSSACGSDATLGDVSIEICSDLLSRTDEVELIVGRAEGFANSLPPGASLENFDGTGPDELIWPVPEPSGGWSGDLLVHIANVTGNESVAARVTYDGSAVAVTAQSPLRAGVRLPVCLPTADGGMGPDGGPDVDGGFMEDDVRITNAGGGDSTLPSMTSTGSALAVAWADSRDGNQEIYFARLTDAGEPVGSELRVTDDAALSSAPSLVWTGSEYGLAWHDERDGNSEIYFTRISAAGALVGSPIRITNASGASAYPSLIHNGGGYGVAWEDDRDGFFQVYFTRLDSTGSEIGDDLRITNTTDTAAAAASLAWTGSEYGLAWHDRRDNDEEIYFVRLDGNGGKLMADERITAASGLSLIPSLVWTGDGFGVAWEDGRDGLLGIFFVEITASGDKLSTEIGLSPANASGRSADLLWTGTQYDLAWSDRRDDESEIYFAGIDSAGDLIGMPTPLTNSGIGSFEPALARANSETKAAWQDSRDGNLEIYFQASTP